MSLSIRFMKNYTWQQHHIFLFWRLQWILLGWKTMPQLSESKMVKSWEMKIFSKFDVKFDVKFENLPIRHFYEIWPSPMDSPCWKTPTQPSDRKLSKSWEMKIFFEIWCEIWCENWKFAISTDFRPETVGIMFSNMKKPPPNPQTCFFKPPWGCWFWHVWCHHAIVPRQGPFS